MRFIGALRVVLSQPTLLRHRPFVEVAGRGARIARRSLALIEDVEQVVEATGEVGARDRPNVLLNEHLAEEPEDERRVIGAQQSPCRARPERRLEVVVQVRHQEPVAITWSRSEITRAVPDAHSAGSVSPQKASVGVVAPARTLSVQVPPAGMQVPGANR